MELSGLKDFFKRNYRQEATEGPSFGEFMEVMTVMNEKKAVSSVVKPIILRLGGV